MMERKDYNNDFEFVRDEGELVFANNGKTCIIFQSGEFWVLEGEKCLQDFLDWLGFNSSAFPYAIIPCVIKEGEFWKQSFLHPKELKELTEKIRSRRIKFESELMECVLKGKDTEYIEGYKYAVGRAVEWLNKKIQSLIKDGDSTLGEQLKKEMLKDCDYDTERNNT